MEPHLTRIARRTARRLEKIRLLFTGWGNTYQLIVKNAEFKKIVINIKQAVLRKMWIPICFFITACFSFTDSGLKQVYFLNSKAARPFCQRKRHGDFYQSGKLSTFAFFPAFCYI